MSIGIGKGLMLRRRLVRTMAVLVAALMGGMANHADAAYFLPGATPSNGTYSWDGPTNWSASSTSGSANEAWPAGDFARFPNANTYTVTVGADESMAGMLTSQGAANTITINQAPATTGDLNIVLGNAGGTDPAVQGFFMGGPVVINAPITGSGGIQPQFNASGAALSLFGNNSYTGGTLLTSSSTLINFNNNNSFGTGTIYAQYAAGSFAPLLSQGGSLITLPNNFVNSGTGGGINFGSSVNTPVTVTGTLGVGTNPFALRNNGGSTAPLKLTNSISGSGAMTLSTNSTGSTITFSGSGSTYTGPITLTGAGGTGAGSGNIRLILGASNTMTTSSSMNLAGGILDPGGANQSMTGTTLGLLTSTGASTIDYVSGASEVDFANSSGLSWSGSVLNLANWNAASDALRVGTDSTGLTAAQLAKIEFNGAAGTLGTAGLDANGFVVQTPEPGCIALLGLGSLGLLRRRRAK